MNRQLGISLLLAVTASSAVHAAQLGMPGMSGSPSVPGMGMSAFAEYSSHDAKLDSENTIKLSGVGLGVSTNPALSGAFGRVDYLTDNRFDVDYYELQGGGQLNLFNANGVYLLATAGVGVAGADSSYLDNSVTFLSLPVGLEVGFSPVPQFSLYGGVGYKWLFDVTGKTTCNDGTTTNSTGHGACSYHNGIDYYNETIGDADGVTFRAGLRVNF